MGVLIRLEDEEGFEMGFIEETELLRPLIPSLDNDQYELLGYIDPYGDTIFNWVQAVTLINDLMRIRGKVQTAAAETLIDRIIELASQCASQPNLYLKFIGD